jgi:hypothetical protein
MPRRPYAGNSGAIRAHASSVSSPFLTLDEASRRKLDKSCIDPLDNARAKDPTKIPEHWEDLPLPPGIVVPLE